MKRMGYLSIACATALMVACAPNGRDDSSVIGADDRDRTAVGTTGEADRDARLGMRDDDAHEFVREAAMHGNAEVQLGELASERAMDPEVRQFAQMMVRDHTQANNQLKQMVSAHGVELPADVDAEHRQLMDRLRNLSGAEFDREYMSAMVEGHEEVKSKLERWADRQPDTGIGTTGTEADRTPAAGEIETRDAGEPRQPTESETRIESADAQLDGVASQWASQTLPTVEQHLERAQEIHERLESNETARN